MNGVVRRGGGGMLKPGAGVLTRVLSEGVEGRGMSLGKSRKRNAGGGGKKRCWSRRKVEF